VIVVFQIFSYFVENVIVVNRIVVIAKHITKKLEQIVVKEKQRKELKLVLNYIQLLQNNVQEQHKKAQDVKIG